jgi:ABC-type oligopeptide transport system substrate-binding subunit
MMRLSLKAMAIASGLVWGAAILCAGVIHLADPSYGVNFLQMTSSVYPGFHAAGTAGRVAIGTVEGLIDGAVAGLVLAWLYNRFTHVPGTASQQ